MNSAPKTWMCLPRRVPRGVLAWALVPALALAGCGGAADLRDTSACGVGAPAEVVADTTTDRLAIVNDDTSLGGMVNCRDEAVLVEAKALEGGGKSHGDVASVHGFSLTLVAEVDPPTVVGLPRFVGGAPGGTLDDLDAGGDFTGDGPVFYRVEVDGAGTPDTFRWSDDGGATWVETGVPVGAAAYPLTQGVTVAFGADTGHAVGDAWTFEAARLQATSVAMHGSHQVVSYAVAGAPHLGAIQVFQKFTHDPVLRSQVIFRDTEIHAADVAEGFVYGAGATEPGTFASLAELERFKLEGSRLTLMDYARIGLPGFAATGVTRDAQTVYATSGTAGGLSVLAAADLGARDLIPLDDARWVATDKGKVAVVQGGATGGTLDVFDRSTLVAAAHHPFEGADTPEAKTTVEVRKGNAYIAAGHAGVRVLSLATGEVRAKLDVPAVTGLDPSDVAANAVTVDNDLMFISFGAAGVYVAKAGCRFDALEDGAPLDLTVLGRLAFGDFASANHVAYLDEHLFVASGLGGLKIVRVERSDGKKK